MIKRFITFLLLLILSNSCHAQGSAIIPFITPYIRTLLDDVTQAAAKVTLGITDEEIQDLVGAMLGGTQTFIVVTYQDGTNDIDFVVPVKDEDDMVSNSDAHLVTQQSAKTYSDNQAGAGPGNVVYREIRTDFSLMKKGASPPGEEQEAIGASGNILAYNYAFNPAAGSDEEVFFHVIIPSDIDETQNVQFFVGSFPDVGWGSGGYRWVLEYLVKDVDDMYGLNIDRSTNTPTIIYANDIPANATDLIETVFYDPNTIDANKNQVIFCRLSLDASESSADDDAHLYYTMFQYASDTPGPTQGDKMLFEDGDVMLFEDGSVMIYEEI